MHRSPSLISPSHLTGYPRVVWQHCSLVISGNWLSWRMTKMGMWKSAWHLPVRTALPRFLQLHRMAYFLRSSNHRSRVSSRHQNSFDPRLRIRVCPLASFDWLYRRCAVRLSERLIQMGSPRNRPARHQQQRRRENLILSHVLMWYLRPGTHPWLA